jgi:hypothetical protein
MKKNTKRARLQSLDNAQLAQVAGGSILSAAGYYSPKSGWYEFYYAAWDASGGCETNVCGYSSTTVP